MKSAIKLGDKLCHTSGYMSHVITIMVCHEDDICNLLHPQNKHKLFDN